MTNAGERQTNGTATALETAATIRSIADPAIAIVVAAVIKSNQTTRSADSNLRIVCGCVRVAVRN